MDANTKRTNHKLEKLSTRQERPLSDNDGAIKALDNFKSTVFVKDLSYGLKHPVKDKFIETNFCADIDKSLNNMRQNGVKNEKLCVIEASAKWYAINQRETPVDRNLAKVTNYFKEHELLAVKFVKGNSFCVMRKSTYEMTLDKVIYCPHFSRIDASDDIITKIERILGTLYCIRKNRTW